MNYDSCTKQWETTRKRKLDNNTYLEARADCYAVRLHATDVIEFHADGRIILNSGGWKTSTTKDRMNKFAPVRISQARGLWTVNYAGQSYPYADGMTLHPDGSVSGAGDDPKAELKLMKSIAAFAKGYMGEFDSGNIPAPGNGDCWICLMGMPDNGSHFLSHIEEKYYVPSILNNVLKTGGVSQACRMYVGEKWGGGKSIDRFGLDFCSDQLRKGIVKLMRRELGIAS